MPPTVCAMRRTALVLLATVLPFTALACSKDKEAKPTETSMVTATMIPSEGGSSAPPTTAAPVDKAAIAFKPVLSSTPCGAEGDTTGVPDGEHQLCYELGDSPVNGSIIEKAEAITEDGGWRVRITFRADDLDGLNALFADCADGAPSCPAGEGGHGAIAIVTGDVVAAAPLVQTASVENGQLDLTGTYTEASASFLAAALGG